MKTKNKENRKCGDCWQHGDDHCSSCNRFYCYWFAETKQETAASHCKAFNPRNSEDRKHRDDNAEKLVVAEGVWKFLREELKLSRRKAWVIFYHLQEHANLITDEIELCDACGKLFLSDREGVICAAESGTDWPELPRYWRHKILCGACLSEKSSYAY